jgi:hypothetical protein
MQPISGRGYRTWVIAAATGAAMLVAGIGVGIAVGTHHQQRPHVAIGRAYSTRQEITVKSPDWAYGVPLDTPWYDGTGGEHFGSRPSCIPPTGYVPNVHVQWVSYLANGATQRQVVAVDC